MRCQIDLKLTRKDLSKVAEPESRISEKREEKERQKKMKEKIMTLDYELKKEMLKS